jgi:hypothetical protein
MNRFTAPRVRFDRQAQAADTLPTPTMRRAASRRTAMLAEAAEVLDVLPGPGESLHGLMTGRYDLAHLVAAAIGKLGTCSAVRLATLSYNARNLAELLTLLDSKRVRSLTLLCSAFFRDHNKELWAETLEEFRARGQRAAAARSHAKVVCMALDDGRRYVLEGSANLRTNSNREQFALFNDAGLHNWHAAWIDALVTQHEGEEAKTEAR